VFVDGNAGDDRIELIDTTIRVVDFLDVQIYGERVFETFASGTTGNDTIQMIRTNLLSRAFISVKVYGETNQGGVVTGGNDTITIADSVLRAAGGFFHSVQLEVVGDSNASLGGQTSTVGGGSDQIAVRDTTIAAASDAFSFGNSVSVNIVGDFNDVRAFNPDTFGGEDAAATVGEGNDRIEVTNSDITVSGPNSGTSQVSVTIVGDRNYLGGFLPDDATAATIGGGNDEITFAGSTVSATGAISNAAVVEIRGEDIQAIGPDGASTTSTVGGGNDRIGVTDTAVVADGELGDLAALVVRSEYLTAFGSGASVVGGGNDRVAVRNVRLPGTAANDFRSIMVETGSGNDRVEVADSAARHFTVHTGDGNDRLTFTANVIGTEASLDGGPGFDRLAAHGNTGLVIVLGFEDEDA
jgi:hypothetical protein